VRYHIYNSQPVETNYPHVFLEHQF
jgi:hypothetical protein